MEGCWVEDREERREEFEVSFGVVVEFEDEGGERERSGVGGVVASEEERMLVFVFIVVFVLVVCSIVDEGGVVDR